MLGILLNLDGLIIILRAISRLKALQRVVEFLFPVDEMLELVDTVTKHDHLASLRLIANVTQRLPLEVSQIVVPVFVEQLFDQLAAFLLELLFKRVCTCAVRLLRQLSFE